MIKKSISTSLREAASKLRRLAAESPMKSSQQREQNQIAADLEAHADEIPEDGEDPDSPKRTDADGNAISPLTGGTGSVLDKVTTQHGFEEQRAKGETQEDPEATDPVPLPNGLEPGQTPESEVGGIPASQSTDPGVNIIPVATIDAPEDPQIPALITPPNEPFPSPAVVVVQEGDSPMEVTGPDGELEGKTATADTDTKAEKKAKK